MSLNDVAAARQESRHNRERRSSSQSRRSALQDHSSSRRVWPVTIAPPPPPARHATKVSPTSIGADILPLQSQELPPPPFARRDVAPEPPRAPSAVARFQRRPFAPLTDEHQAPGEGARKRRTAAFLSSLLLVVTVIITKFNVAGKIDQLNVLGKFDRRLPLLTMDDYAYAIVTYHKADHSLSHTLAVYMQQHIFNSNGSKLRRVNAHMSAKLCDELSLYPGKITIIESSDFYCDKFSLDMLMSNPDPATRGNAGVKIIHLVRNPFTMAVSDYFYHRQDPTPEPFVHWTDPCRPQRQRRVVESFEDGVVLSHEDYDTVIGVCRSLYQTMPGLENATYYEHLRTLDPIDGLRIVTAEKFHSVATMANDLVAFRRFRDLVGLGEIGEGAFEAPGVETVIMGDWMTRPKNSMYAFLSFLFPNNSDGDARYFMPEHKKNSIAKKYVTSYHKKAETWDHITFGNNSGASELIEGLRRDAALGGLLGKIELLLDAVVEEERSEQRFAVLRSAGVIS